MKTRRKTIKSPTKGRRSSIICVKKSPIIRRNLRRNVRVPIKNLKLTEYESPLLHFRSNCSTDIATDIATSDPLSSTCLTNYQDIKKINLEDDEIKDNSKNLKNTKIKKKANISKEINKGNDLNVNTQTSSKCKNNKMHTMKTLDNLLKNSPKSSKTFNKSLLSSIDQKSDVSTFSDSVIIVDDCESKSTKNLKSDSSSNSPLLESVTICDNNCTSNILAMSNTRADRNINTESMNTPSSTLVTNSEDIVIIDGNDTLNEMEAYHEAFNQSTNLSSNNLEFADSVIVIDPDDEPPVQAKNRTPKPAEDCFVVWSSFHKPCSSNNLSNIYPCGSNKTSSTYNNFDILKCDKISLDTNPELKNLTYLNNENNVPTKKKSVKTSKIVTRGVRKNLLRTAMDQIKTASKLATKAETKTVKKTTVKSASKSVTANPLKKKVTNGELIFLSESKESGEDATKKRKSKKGKLREIVIDGSNVAMAYTNNKMFSEKGIKVLIDYFTKKGHTIKVFVPQYRRSRNCPLLEKWHNEGIVVFTPSRKLGNKSFTPYDDRYILEYATACDGIVVSQDQFRDLYAEKPQYRDTIENRLLVPTFVGDYVMFPEDPLGRDGPTLTEFLRH